MLTKATRLEDFPALAGMTYLNTAAESIPPRCTQEAIEAYWSDKLQGMRGRMGHFAAVEACREVSARLLGLKTSEVSFCSCSSEAYNLLASALQLGPEDEVVVTDLDFPAGVTPWMCGASAPKMHLWKAVDGSLNTEDLLPLLNERTKLVQVSLVSFYNGHRIDWQPFRDRVRRLAPSAVISVDVTQAFGRVVLDCEGADILISSTHKWTLGIHGGCVIGIPEARAESLTTHAGGWLHLENAFAADRFQRVIKKTGAASFSVGMPNFIALYALNASLRYLETVGIANIAAHADPLVKRVQTGLRALGLETMCRFADAGIIAFQHSKSDAIHAALELENIHVMNNAGRIRVSVHGYNTPDDIDHFLQVLTNVIKSF